MLVEETCPKCSYRSIKLTNALGVSKCAKCNIFLKERIISRGREMRKEKTGKILEKSEQWAKLYKEKLKPQKRR